MALSSAQCCFLLVVSFLLIHCSFAARLLDEQPRGLSYHKGSLLTGPISLNLIWYGRFSASQRAIVSDFFSSLSSHSSSPHTVAAWWQTIDHKFYHYDHSKTTFPTLLLASQFILDSYPLGKSLTDADLTKLASNGAKKDAINVVLTAEDVTVDGFCMSRCGTHGASPPSKAGRFAYIWVGNSATQCPGQCAWPFHQPIYGPQGPALVAPNGDVGVDGMVINLASMVAGAVTNPFGNGFYQGPKEAPLEAATACPGVYGTGTYPGYAGELLVDPATGGSYNANGAGGRRFLLPALFDPSTFSCSTLGRLSTALEVLVQLGPLGGASTRAPIVTPEMPTRARKDTEDCEAAEAESTGRFEPAT